RTAPRASRRRAAARPSASRAASQRSRRCPASPGATSQASRGDLPGSASPSSPVTQSDLAGNSFVCRGVTVPHGPGASATFQIDQTEASKKAKFTPRSVNLKTSQPLSEDGKAAGGVTTTGLSVDQPILEGGRLVMKVTATINTSKDAPDRLEGPFILTVTISGKDSKNKAFDGSLPCAFYVDHTANAVAFDPSIDGFVGGPGRASKPGNADPKFLIVPHGKKITIPSDAPVSQQDSKNSTYDKSSLTVFDGKGKKVDQSKLKEMAGVKKIHVPKSGRGIKIATAKDNRTPPVERIVVRLSGVDGTGVAFTDYYRIVIIHEKGKKARSLVSDLNDKYVMVTQEENEPYEVAWAADGAAIYSMIPAGDGLVWDREKDCEVSSGGEVHGIMNGSRAFIFDYSDGASDIYQLPDLDDLAQTSGNGTLDCQGDATNVTNWYPFWETPIERGNVCDSKFYATEFNFEEFNVFVVQAPPSMSFPIPVEGGDNIRSTNCYNVDSNGTFALVGSTPGDENRSNLVNLPLVECGGTCTQAAHEATLLFEAENPNEHLVSAVVSPDVTKIAFEYVSATGSQIWVGDFDAQIPAISNAAAVTSEGNNGTPTWSPDSQQLAFVSDRDDNLEIYVMNADGSDQQNITNTPDMSETDPSWMTP
ncbi:MAG: TolB family protein, partial [Dehalococcoidia bacterium]